MYMHAHYRRTNRDDPDSSELREVAGISPKGMPNWVHEVKRAVAKGEKETKNSAQLVRHLNERRILNARGYPWTHAALAEFIRHYIILRRS